MISGTLVKIPLWYSTVFLVFIAGKISFSQVTIDFQIPDTVFVNEPIQIVNSTTGGSTFYWNFCTGDLNSNPIGQNMGNPWSALDIPTYITLVRQGNECFSFISCQGSGIIRIFHGSSFRNDPVQVSIIGKLGVISYNQEGIRIINENGQWIGLVCSDTKLIRIDFGTSLWNTPSASVVNNIPPQNMLHGLSVVNENGHWIALATCSLGNTVIRLDFGSSLKNNPIYTNFGNIANFQGPGAICLLYEDNFWYAILISGHTSLARLDFGSSLLNNPTSFDLGNPGGFDFAVGLTIHRDCDKTTGYWVNYLSYGILGKLQYPNGIMGQVVGSVLGNIGSLSKPHSFSELFRQNDTLYAYISNRENNSLSRLVFPPCNQASILSSSLFTPPPFTYNQPGTYNIRLIVNEGMPDQVSICKNIVVIPKLPVVVVDFEMPDTVCINTPINIRNFTTGGNTYYWNFCSGNSLDNPVGVNIGNPGGLLDTPVYLTLQKDNGTCYSFITSRGNSSVVRYNHGNCFSNPPQSWTKLGSFGMINDSLLGIKICKDKGIWIGFLCDNNRIIRLNFGTSLNNEPVAKQYGPYEVLNTAHCIDIQYVDGIWVGFLTCSLGNKFVRLEFGNSLLNDPVLTELGTQGSINFPVSFRLIEEKDIWYAIISNSGDNTLTRLNFGTSLLNIPIGENLGVVCQSINPGGITLFNDCESMAGFQLNYSSTSDDLIWRLDFYTDVSGNVYGTSIGNIGQMSRPAHFSEMFRVGDTIFVYNSNIGNNTLTRLTFPPCNNASIPSSTLFNPPPVSFNQTGNYNVRLIVNEGMPNQSSVCKNITVVSQPLSKYIDTTLCTGDSIWAGGRYQHQQGVYYDTITFINSCDSVIITNLKITDPVVYVIDTLLCTGDSIFIEGKWQHEPGSFFDTIPLPAGCDSIIKINIGFKDSIHINLGPDTTLCFGTVLLLKTGVPMAQYLWQNGSTDSTFLATETGQYWVEVTKQGCHNSDTINLRECQSHIIFPNAFTPNDDGINDQFRAIGSGVIQFSMEIYNRWGELIFKTDDFNTAWDGRFKGSICADGVYFYIAKFVMAESVDEMHHSHGSVTLLR